MTNQFLNSDSSSNYSQSEVEHFNKHAYAWWDNEGPLKTLHQINPIRLKWIQSHLDIQNKILLDVGCGGGILSDGMARGGAKVLGIDVANEAIEVAKLHALDSGVHVDYQSVTIESIAGNPSYIGAFDAVTCLEMLEHVPNPKSIIQSCAKLVKPNGLVFFSTLNRNLKTYLTAILGAEYILNMLPKGTHTYSKCIKPSELSSWCEEFGLIPQEFKGIGYNPFFKSFYLQDSVDVNYLLVCKKSA
ncbi:MAG: Ubiquinone biosynthesis O-methyltransferase [Pseudomonadota bacterium]|jgi:2-polyprenyl-6-hydroxyphenyl methylase/3-demethylubiquinone-9 3-methyltransferase